MWRRIELKNYRSIESAQVDLAPFTLLVGPNGSGKSNFADALVFVSELEDASTAVARRGGINGLIRWQSSARRELSIALRAAWSREQLDQLYSRYQFTIEVDQANHWKFANESITDSNNGAITGSISREADGVVRMSPQQVTFPVLTAHASITLLVKQVLTLRSGIPTGIPFTGVQRYRLNPDQMRQPHPDSDASFLNESGSNIAEALQRLRERQDGSFEDVLSSMSRIVPGLMEIETPKVGHFRTLQFTQHQATGSIAKFTAMELSDGSLRALGILVASRQVQQNSLLIVEEPEVHLHPGATAVLFEALKQASQRGAVLITTHSPELLDAARDEEILVCDYRSGITRIGPLDSEQRQIVREGLFSAAELMRTTPLRIEGDAPATLVPPSAP
jgi:type I restriction enzyme M protein